MIKEHKWRGVDRDSTQDHPESVVDMIQNDAIWLQKHALFSVLSCLQTL